MGTKDEPHSTAETFSAVLQQVILTYVGQVSLTYEPHLHGPRPQRTIPKSFGDEPRVGADLRDATQLQHAHACLQQTYQGRYQATWKREFKFPWRRAGPLRHLDDVVDLDQ